MTKLVAHYAFIRKEGRGLLVKAGYGVFVRASIYCLTGNPISCIDLMSIGFETMKDLAFKFIKAKRCRILP